MHGIIFDIKKFAVHDGPGIRTTVFFKGCPLRCYWCHNPESISPRPQLAQFPRNCIGCGACIEVCPQGALSRGEKQIVIDRDLCQACGSCAAECYAEALVMQGRVVTVEAVIAEVLKDRLFYENSGGGITLSGGEPMLQPAFALALLERAKDEGLHTVLDTCGQAAWESYAAALPHLDMVLYDLKCADPQRHREATGAANGVILENLRRLAETDVAICVRVPVVAGLNADEGEMAAIGRVVAALSRSCPVELLPYHRLGEGKWRALGLASPRAAPDPPTKETLHRLANVLADLGAQCTVGG